MPATAIAMAADDTLLRAQFGRLLAEHGPGLRRVARAYTRGAHEAADLTQDIALAVWRALPTFRADCSERTFVFRVAHNRGISHAETTRVRERETPLVEAPPVADGQPAADEALDAARRHEALWNAIASLAVGARSVLSLALEGMSHAEIADVLGIEVNTVAVRLSRARTELRAMLRGGES